MVFCMVNIVCKVLIFRKEDLMFYNTLDTENNALYLNAFPALLKQKIKIFEYSNMQPNKPTAVCVLKTD